MLFSLRLPTIFCRSDVAQDGAKEAGGEEGGESKASSKAKKKTRQLRLYPVDKAIPTWISLFSQFQTDFLKITVLQNVCFLYLLVMTDE